MSKVGFLFCLVCGLAIAAIPHHVAQGELTLAPQLTAQAKGIHTLFISVYDPKSQMPMPVAAVKVDLSQDAKGSFYHFDLTPQTMMLMVSASELPSVVNLKAKLDRDGSAGPDAPGDLVGWVKNVKVGAKNVKLTIDKAVR